MTGPKPRPRPKRVKAEITKVRKPQLEFVPRPRPRRMGVVMRDSLDGYDFTFTDNGPYCMWSDADEIIAPLEEQNIKLRALIRTLLSVADYQPGSYIDDRLKELGIT